MKQMKKLMAVLLVMALAIGMAQTVQGTTAQAAGKYPLKVKAGISGRSTKSVKGSVTMEVGQSLELAIGIKEKVVQGKKVGQVCGYGINNTKKSEYLPKVQARWW